MTTKEEQLANEIECMKKKPYFGTMTNGTILKSPCTERIKLMEAELKGRLLKEREMIGDELFFLEEEVLPKIKIQLAVLKRISNLKRRLNELNNTLNLKC